jgi:mannose-1-phosphate guanylyltransferase/mannose-6-phosphate isomerase
MITENTSCPTFGVILAGGSGTRFWPLSRSQYPKQVLRLLGSDSMLQATIGRLLPWTPLERMAVVTNVSQEEVIRLELYRKGWDRLQLWLEPQGRNTAAAVGLAATRLQTHQNDVIMAVFPADHYIQDQASLIEALNKGTEWARAGYLVTFGILPTRPETGYGYIKAEEPLNAAKTAFKCARFIEKPDSLKAQAFIAEGNYYWNSGIFMFRRDIILEALARYLPEVYQGLMLLPGKNDSEYLEEVYKGLPSLSIDYGVLERADNVVVVPVQMGWSDVGTWGAVYELSHQKDLRGNVILGRALDRGSHGCLIYGQERLVATLGLENIIVVDTPDATLLCHRDRVQEVKDLVAELHRQNCVETRQHPTVERPWGCYKVIDSGPGYQVKQIVVDPGKRLSLQLHQHRAEHWVVVQGTARVTIGGENIVVAANESVFIPRLTPHRLENLGQEPLRIIETQTGAYLEEDDIVRLADDYWRTQNDPQEGAEELGKP